MIRAPSQSTPGEGEEADTKAGIEKLIESFVAPYCGEGHKPPKVANYQIRAICLSPDYIMIVRSADVVEGKNTTRVRATELIREVHPAKGEIIHR